MKQRQFKSHEHTNGLAAKSANAQVSMIMSPMQNSDIKEFERTGDWGPMKSTAKKMHLNYLNRYGSEASFCQKKPDGNFLKKGMKQYKIQINYEKSKIYYML